MMQPIIENWSSGVSAHMMRARSEINIRQFQTVGVFPSIFDANKSAYNNCF